MPWCVQTPGPLYTRKAPVHFKGVQSSKWCHRLFLYAVELVLKETVPQWPHPLSSRIARVDIAVFRLYVSQI